VQTDQQTRATVWPDEIFEVLKENGVTQVAYVPDAGHTKLINRCHADKSMKTVVLTTEEEGVAMMAGSFMGGAKGVLLLQSSGVGNCINMLSLTTISRFPLLMLVTMRGEWAELNPWQVPMGMATEPALNAIGVRTFRADTAADLLEIAASAATLAFEADQQVAVLMSQRLIGAKKW
jgi:sulfopyruvate decarboxylase alpha subunit